MDTKIKFLDETGKEAFQINDGDTIHITDGYAYNFSIRCHYVDEEYFLLGTKRTNLLEFAKYCHLMKRTFKPEENPESYIGGWQVFMKNQIGYLTVQELADEPGWDCTFYDLDFDDIDTALLPADGARNIIEARNRILVDFPEWDDCYMKPFDWEMIYENNIERMKEKVSRLQKSL